MKLIQNQPSLIQSFLAIIFLAAFSSQGGQLMPSAENSIYKIPLLSIESKSLSMKDFKDKAILVVNTASQCGYTPQYKALQDLYEQFKDQGFVVLGVPCNQFGGQEPGSEREIKHFCEVRYGVKFPLLKKAEVNGSNRHPLYQYLIKHSSDQTDIQWNFEKFLISKSGKVIKRFRSATDPKSPELIQAIHQALKE
jgi:glutathione peroxidase